VVGVEVAAPPPAEQAAVWRSALGPLAGAVDGAVDRLVSQFSLTPHQIHDACAQARAELAGGRPDPLAAVWDACRGQARFEDAGLAERIEPAATWDDLVLPDPQRRALREVALQTAGRYRVYERWGFARSSRRGLGVSALFTGGSGTGKTMAAEVLASELRLDLYRIDLSQVVSKYVGETEKNLRRVFDAAEGGAAILLFDEADALFGKRTEVRDSHDRYANIEVGYLLQRMEAYRGLAILTTNLKDALDAAFLRRIRFTISFPFPDEEQRAAIWRRTFPPAAPTEGLEVAKLARLHVAGGSIRNIALHAAFLAAAGDRPIRMADLLEAARSECAKLHRPLTDAEVGDWTRGALQQHRQ
jgi:SpoVK/Ycf46/Vps4 family AAA+-type ATPase